MRDQEHRIDPVATLQVRMPEIQRVTVSRLHAIWRPADRDELEYLQDLREAVEAGLNYGLGALNQDGTGNPPIPAVLLEQARQAARSGIGIDTMLRLYVAGYTSFAGFLTEEVEKARRIDGLRLGWMQDVQVALDPLLAAVGAEYSHIQQGRLATTEERRADRVMRLLSGELVDTAELAYEFSGHHLGLVATGPTATAAIRAFAEPHDRRLLLIRPDENTVWAWLGGRARFDRDALRGSGSDTFKTVPLALGEPAEGFNGWRRTHRQALAAHAAARAEPGRPVPYSEVALFVALSQNELLAESLRELYLAPLKVGRGGDRVLKETLRAYFAAGRNVSSTASALGVTRQTVGNRLRAVETRLDRNLGSCWTEVELALRLEVLERVNAGAS